MMNINLNFFILGLGLPCIEDAPMIQRIVTDSRLVQAGDLFVPLRGERFDGHDFLEQAWSQGAVAVLTERSSPVPRRSEILVKDTQEALLQLAHLWREHCQAVVIAVTGSNGKTTLKEMIANILIGEARRNDWDPQEVLLVTEGNLNNHVGVPLTLFRMRPQHRWACVEMGMNHAGEIRTLSLCAQPDIAVINNVQRAHVGGFLDGIMGVARAKAEIYAGLKVDGIAIYPIETPFASIFQHEICEHAVCTVGFSEQAMVSGQVINGSLRVRTQNEDVVFSLRILGQHNQHNALMACAVAHSLGISLAVASRALSEFEGVPGRLQQKVSVHGGHRVLDDTYNGNPDSVRAAMDVLAELPGERVFILGDLGELGAESMGWHRELGEYAKKLGIEHLWTVGKDSQKAQQGFGMVGRHCQDKSELKKKLVEWVQPQMVFLVKGSRFMQMEQIVEELVTCY